MPHIARRLLILLALSVPAMWLVTRPAMAASIVDATGRTVALPDQVLRVLPAGPPAAVLLAALAPDLMLGWPHRPDEAAAAWLPNDVAALPEIGPLRPGPDLAARIRALRPDLILDYGSTAARYADRAEQTETATGVPTILLDGRLAFTPLVLRLLGRALHREDRAEDLAQLAEGVLASVGPHREGLSVVYVHGAEGQEVAVPGGANSEVLEFLGWQLRAPPATIPPATLPPENGPQNGPFRHASVAEIAALDPDLLIFSDAAMRARVAAAPEWRALRAVRDGHAFVAPAAPFGWIEGPPSINRLLGLAWLGSGAPSTGVVPMAAVFNLTAYRRVPTPGQIATLRRSLMPVEP